MVVEQVGHVDTSLLIDAPTVHLADQRVPVLPPCPPLPPLSPPPLLAETSFHAARATLQCPKGSIPSLGLTPSFHHTDHTIIGTQGPTQPLSSMVPRLLSHGGEEGTGLWTVRRKPGLPLVDPLHPAQDWLEAVCSKLQVVKIS